MKTFAIICMVCGFIGFSEIMKDVCGIDFTVTSKDSVFILFGFLLYRIETKENP